MSWKINSLISEVGLQDSADDKFIASTKFPQPPARRIPVRSKTQYPPLTETSRNDEWASYPLLSLLTRSSTLLKSDEQIEEQMAETIGAQIQASRGRTNTTSSTGSSTIGSKASRTDSESGSSAPTSRSSSTRSSPYLGSKTHDSGIKPFPPLYLPSTAAADGLISVSPEQNALPTFDFGIFQSLPLPPGHKQSISNDKESTPVSSRNMGTKKTNSVRAPPRHFASDSSKPSFALKTLEKPASRRQSEAMTQVLTESDEEELTIAVRSINEPFVKEPRAKMQESPEPQRSARQEESEEVDNEYLQTEMTDCILPETDAVSMIGTSWMNTPRLSRPSSELSTRVGPRTPSLSRAASLSRAISFSRTPSLSRSSSASERLSHTPDLSRSSSTSSKPSRTPSFSLSRSLSRRLSRRSSNRNSPRIEEESDYPAASSLRNNSPPRLARRASDSRGRKEDTIPLNRLIQRSHRLARRLDGLDSHGYAEVLPSTTYKYRLPTSRRSETPVPELRFSKLFTDIGNDLTILPYVSTNFPFSVPRKPIMERDRYSVGRSQSFGTTEERPRDTRVFVRPQIPKIVVEPPPVQPQEVPQTVKVPQTKQAPRPQRPARVPEMTQIKKMAPTQRPTIRIPAPAQQRIPVQRPKERMPAPAVPPLPQVEVCAMCGNTQTIWGRCDCGTPMSARGKAGSRPTQKPVPVKLERRAARRVPKRRSTMKSIRRRVVRAFTL